MKTLKSFKIWVRMSKLRTVGFVIVILLFGLIGIILVNSNVDTAGLPKMLADDIRFSFTIS